MITGGQTLADVNIQRDIFSRDLLFPLMFNIALMLFNDILRKYTWGNKFSKSLEKINHLIYMDDIKMFAKKKQNTRYFNTDNKNIQFGYSNGIWQ